MPRRGHAVHADRVDVGIIGAVPAEITDQASGSGEAVRLGIEGQQHESFGVLFSDIRGRVVQKQIGAVCLKQEVRNPEFQKTVDHKAVLGVHVAVVLHRDGADGSEDISPVGGSAGNLAGGADQCPAVVLGHSQTVHGIGVGLERLTACLAVCTMDGLDFTGVGEACPFAGVRRGVVPLGVAGAHAAVKQQNVFL